MKALGTLFGHSAQRMRSKLLQPPDFPEGMLLRRLPCKRNIEMTPLCKVEVTHPWVLGSREVRRGGGVDEQAGVQPS